MMDSSVLRFAEQQSRTVRLALEAAKCGGEVLLQFWRALGSNRIEEKGKGDLVTEADFASEKAICEFLQKETPEWSMIAEEGTERSGGDTVWFVDPLDGTTNFVQRLPIFAVSVGLAKRLADGRFDLLAGAVWNPISDELFWSAKGCGSYRGMDRLHVSTKERLADAVIGTGFPRRYADELSKYLKEFEALYLQCRAIRRPGAASLDLCWTAQGVYDAFWEHRLSPWDIGAGCLIAMEAGGICTDFLGEMGYMQTGNILAAPAVLHRQILEILRPLQ